MDEFIDYLKRTWPNLGDPDDHYTELSEWNEINKVENE